MVDVNAQIKPLSVASVDMPCAVSAAAEAFEIIKPADMLAAVPAPVDADPKYPLVVYVVDPN